MAAHAEGCWINDNDGNGYLDAAGGAVVVNVGHGDPDVLAVLAGGSGTVDYVHPSVFTTESVESYAKALSTVLPVEDPRVYPVSGGSEAVETALKLARSYHLARGNPERTVVISRSLSYHGSTLHALDASGRLGLRAPYEPWLGRTVKVPPVTEYRCPAPGHPDGCAHWHAAQLEDAVLATGPERVAAFIGEAMGGATLGATAPPDGYWKAIAEVCDRYDILLIVDEVMTGFGRTGKWFGIDHAA